MDKSMMGALPPLAVIRRVARTARGNLSAHQVDALGRVEADLVQDLATQLWELRRRKSGPQYTPAYFRVALRHLGHHARATRINAGAAGLRAQMDCGWLRERTADQVGLVEARDVFRRLAPWIQVVLREDRPLPNGRVRTTVRRLMEA